MEILLFLLLILAFALVAQRWGTDSTDSIDNPEWKRREGRGNFV